MKVTDAGLDLIKKHEGLRLTAYRCPAGVWTIGYGITSSAGVGKVTPGMKITEAEADDMLRRALFVYERGVQDALTRRPTRAQFDAMVSLAFNIGVPAFRKSSVVRHFNAGDLERAAGSFLLWNKAAGKVLHGLTKRRQAEREWFLRPELAPPPVVKEPLTTAAPPAAEPTGKESLQVEEPETSHGPRIAGWVLGALTILIAAAAAFIAKGN